MSRFLALMFVFTASLLMPATRAEAQRLPLPSRGETLPLASDDPRCDEGYRCYMIGAWVPGVSRSLQSLIDEVNADLPEGSQVTWAQFEEANSCQIIYRRREGDRMIWRHNGSCGTNPTEEPVTYASFCGAGTSCDVWSISTPRTIYRIPAAPRLTPTEEAEQMISEIREAPTTPTVNAPEWIAPRMARMRALLNSDYPPSEELQAAFYEAVEQALASTPQTTGAAEPPPDMVFDEPASAPTSVPEVRVVPVETPFYTYVWYVVVLIALCIIAFLIGRKTGSVTAPDDGTASDAAQEEISRLRGKLAGENTKWMAQEERYKDEIRELKHAKGELTTQLNSKRANEAAETATNRENAELVDLIRVRWGRFASQVKADVKLNVNNINRMFADLEQFQVLRSVWPSDFGLLDRTNFTAVIGDAAEFRTRPDPSQALKNRITDLEREIATLKNELRTSALKAEGDEALISEKSAKIEELGQTVGRLEIECRERLTEVEKERKDREEAQSKSSLLEATNFNLVAALKTVTDDTLAMLSPYREKHEHSPTWALSAKTTIDAIEALIEEHLAPFKELFDTMFGENGMVPAAAAPLGGEVTQIASVSGLEESAGKRKKRGRRDTASFARDKVKAKPNGNGSAVEREPSWGSDPPPAAKHKGTLPPGAGTGLFGPSKVSESDRESLVPPGVPRVATSEEYGTEPEVAPPAAPSSEGSSLGTTSIFDGVSDDPTKRLE
ncbi:hypothetical protein IT407_04480 [Candidatus Uhrbacteria bacterium]|nr:hypothetical protein [Candidatus Uhrbacteria bacterium]